LATRDSQPTVLEPSKHTIDKKKGLSDLAFELYAQKFESLGLRDAVNLVWHLERSLLLVNISSSSKDSLSFDLIEMICGASRSYANLPSSPAKSRISRFLSAISNIAVGSTGSKKMRAG